MSGASPIPETIRFLESERARIDECIAVLRALVPGNRQPVSPPPAPKRAAKVEKAAPAEEPPKKRRGRSVGGVLLPAEDAAGIHTCPGCGRDKLRKVPGASGFMSFHYAPCGLPCAASPPRYLDDKESVPDGIHSKRNCPKCKA